MLAAPIDILDVDEPVMVPLVDAAGKVSVPFNINVFPPKTKTPFEKLQDVLAVILPPSVIVPKPARFITKLFITKGDADGIMVPKVPLPPMVKLDVLPPLIVPAPDNVPLSVSVYVLFVLS
jgi:hypothetical protein